MSILTVILHHSLDEAQKLVPPERHGWTRQLSIDGPYNPPPCQCETCRGRTDRVDVVYRISITDTMLRETKS